MLTKFDKAVATTITAGASSFALLSSQCSSIFAIFGSHSTTAQIFSAAVIGIGSGVVTYLIPNKNA